MITERQWVTLAKVYQEAESIPYNPEVREAYKELVRECQKQLDSIPVTVKFTNVNPYITSNTMFEDIEINKRLKVFTGGKRHPLLTQKENSVFRAVHDYYGHYGTKSGFLPGGEFQAWTVHSRMFTGKAKKAMHTETIGQTAYFFYSKGNVGKPNKEKSYAKQKACILDFNFENLLEGV